MNADANLRRLAAQRHGGQRLQRVEPSLDGTNSVVLVCLGVAEVGEDSVAKILSDVALVPLDGRGADALVLGVDVPKLLGVERL